MCKMRDRIEDGCLGHASPTITLSVYGHLFTNTDDKAAEVMEALFAKACAE